jgi:hypothetical protein
MALSVPRGTTLVEQSRQLLDAVLTAFGLAAGCRAEIALMLSAAHVDAVVPAAGEAYRIAVSVDRRWCVLEVFDSPDRCATPTRRDGAG